MSGRLPEGYRVIHRSQTISTNDDCLAAARSGEAGGLWVIAGQQSRGRGSRGRAWASEPGNLFASLLITTSCPIENLSQLTFVASLAVHDAVQAVAREERVEPRLALKWPNDVLVNGRKACGILLESHVGGDKRHAIAGFGINCVSHPDDTRSPATNLRAEGLDIGAETLFERLALAMDRRLRLWAEGSGFQPILADWQRRAQGIGEHATIALPGGAFEGLFEALNQDGHLVLKLADGGRKVFSAAEVFFPGTAVPTGDR